MKDEYITCALCKKRIILKPTICFDNQEKEWWWEPDSKPYWTNKDSGKTYCDECLGYFFWEEELDPCA